MPTKPPPNGSKNPPVTEDSTAVAKDAVIELVTDVAEEAAARGADRALDDFREEISSIRAIPEPMKEKPSVPGWVSAVIGALCATLVAFASYVYLFSETKATALIAKDKINVVETQQKEDVVRFKKWVKVNNKQHKAIVEQNQRTDRNIEKMLKKMNLEPEPAPPPALDSPDEMDDLDL